MRLPERPSPPLPLAISECLLGSEVRYDGSGARSSMPHAALEGLFSYRGICPEVGVGMGVPRPPVRLVDHGGRIRVTGVETPDRDFTDAIDAFGTRTAEALGDVAGYVFMKNSPSCGLFRVKVYSADDSGHVRGAPELRGRGVHAAAVTRALPALPVEDSGRLNDVVLRENFVTRVFAYAHWQRVAADLQPANLIEFHSRYKYLLMAHSVPHYEAAGRLLSNLKTGLAGIAADYVRLLMDGLSRPAPRRGHANVLSHLQGYFKQSLDGSARRELAGLIDSYRRGELPLLAPLTLLRHHLREHPDEYVAAQVYLEPHPPAAGLRRQL